MGKKIVWALLHGPEAEIADLLGAAPALSADPWAGIDPYFRHRFLGSAMIVASADEGLRKVSDAEVGANPCVDSGPAGIAPGPSYHFEAMRVRAQAVATCLLRAEGAKAAAQSTVPWADESRSNRYAAPCRRRKRPLDGLVYGP